MFRIITQNFLNVVFSRHKNGNWKAVAHRGGEKFELARSIPQGSLPWVVDSIVLQDDQEENFKTLCRKLKQSLKKRQKSIASGADTPLPKRLTGK